MLDGIAERLRFELPSVFGREGYSLHKGNDHKRQEHVMSTMKHTAHANYTSS